ncbi:SEC-C domain-containing protein [Clostridium estertheticum]|uniref:SEC-C metal-binding domain-containing protein n=1 Tax=Clostridium estertheticum TaxID=238834 RepID=UPI0013E96738|nr:SEC-C metal-binding domain-containing protein [Clostridium estertheticum]MBZ9684969.1 SEC-C domain-containing protein [Clostridium estertheticum]
MGENLETNPDSKGRFKIVSTYSQNQLKNTDFFTLYLASAISGQEVNFAKDIEIRDIEFDEHELDMKSQNIVSFKMIPNMDYKPSEIDTFFNLEIDEVMNVMTMSLSITDKDKLEKYNYCINLRFTEGGELKLKFNYNNTTNINKIMKFNRMMNIWSIKGFRRFYIKDNEGNILLSTVMGKNDESKNENIYFDNLIGVFKNSREVIESIPLCISSESIADIESWDLKSIKINNEELLLVDRIKEKLSQNVSIVRMFLINQENKYIISVVHLGCLPYLLNMVSFLMKTSNKKKNNEVEQKLKNDDVTLTFEKYIFSSYPTDIYKVIKTMFYSTNKPLEKIINYVLNDKGEKAIGKIHIDLSEKYSSYWHNKIQDVDIKIYICEEELCKINELNTLQQEKKYVQAIPLMENFQHRSFVSKENLAFAYCLNKDFDKSIELCKIVIKDNYKSVCHFTKGLALVLKGELDKAYISYMYGLHLIDKSIWYPHIKDNLLNEIQKNGTEKGDMVKRILENIELFNIRNTNGRHKRCFCGSDRKFKDCHEKKLLETIKNDLF